MPIPRKEANEILKTIKLRYGGDLVKPSINSGYKYIEIFSNEIPIYYKKEFEVAERIGKKHNLKLTFMDFSPDEGKGEKPHYEPVYALTCKSLRKLRKAHEIIATAVAELEKEIAE